MLALRWGWISLEGGNISEPRQPVPQVGVTFARAGGCNSPHLHRLREYFSDQLDAFFPRTIMDLQVAIWSSY